MSEKTPAEPFGETAKIFPVTVPSPVKALFAEPRFAGFTTWAPNALPMYALSPVRSNSRELGETGMGFSGPVEAFAVDRL